jgi:hypothetical protein
MVAILLVRHYRGTQPNIVRTFATFRDRGSDNIRPTGSSSCFFAILQLPFLKAHRKSTRWAMRKYKGLNAANCAQEHKRLVAENTMLSASTLCALDDVTNQGWVMGAV